MLKHVEADYGRDWAYRATTDDGRHLADIKLGDDSDARNWAVNLSVEHEGRVVVVERYEAAADKWRHICKAGPTTASH